MKVRLWQGGEVRVTAENPLGYLSQYVEYTTAAGEICRTGSISFSLRDADEAREFAHAILRAIGDAVPEQADRYAERVAAEAGGV